MDQPSLYDDDIVTWSEQQAASLRALGIRHDLSNVLDWENVAEEIESVGRSHVRAVEGLLTQALTHLIKHISAPDVNASRHWREEIVTFQIAARNRFEASMGQRIRRDNIWKSALEAASYGLLAYGDELLPNLPRDNPFTLDELLSSPFDVDGALRRIAEATDTGREAEARP